MTPSDDDETLSKDEEAGTYGFYHHNATVISPHALETSGKECQA